MWNTERSPEGQPEQWFRPGSSDYSIILGEWLKPSLKDFQSSHLVCSLSITLGGLQE